LTTIEKQPKLPSVKRFPDRQIASLTEPFEDENGLFDVRLISKGMNKEEIEREFPPDSLAIAKARKKGIPIPTFNMRKTLRSMVLQEYEKIGKNRERGNVRHFFYTNVIYTLTRIMGVTNTTSLNTTLNNAWKDVVESGMVTYEGMNIESAKDKSLRSFARHSPFSNYIICVEKESLLESLTWAAQLFRTTIVTAGGQPSRAAIRAFVRSLAYWKNDLEKPFYLLVITDLDAAGWYIQEAFASQIELSLKYYNEGKGKVENPIRLFLRLDQITDRLLDEFAVPAKDKKAKTAQAIKANKTKIKRFKQKLGENWKRLSINNEMMKIELDAIKTTQMEKKIVSELLELIDDHSLILIPEIMDETENQRLLVIQEFYESYKQEFIDPIIDDYLKPIKDKKEDIHDQHKDKKRDALNDYHKIEREVNNFRYKIKYEIQDLLTPIIEKYTDYANSLVEDELEEIKNHRERIEEINEKIRELEEEIEEIEEEIEEVEEVIEEEIGFYREEIRQIDNNLDEAKDHLTRKQYLFLKPAKLILNEKYAIIEAEWLIYQEKLDTFESQKQGNFGSYLRSIEKHFQDSLNSEIVPIFWNDVESDSDVKIQIAYLLTHPKLLLNENITCLEHPKPVFQESNLLQNALSSENIEATKRNPDLSKFRNAFSEHLKKALKKLMKRKLDSVTITLDSVVDLPEEYIDELTNLIKQIKDEINQNNLYQFLNYHPEDMNSQEEE
jgi:hypothetical protein